MITYLPLIIVNPMSLTDPMHTWSALYKTITFQCLIVALAVLAAPDVRAQTEDAGSVLIDDFESYETGKLPTGWDWQENDNQTDKPYVVEQEAGNKYLAADDHGQSVILGKKVKVDIDAYPYLSFRWRVHQLPENGDERHGKTGDSAAAIYVIYRLSFGFIPVTVKYVWSSTLPVGTALQRSGVGRPWIIVAASGKTGMNEWQTHVFDVRAAYRETFGKRPPHKIVAIAVLSDANATKSEAAADYDDIYFLSKAEAGSGIDHVVEAD